MKTAWFTLIVFALALGPAKFAHSDAQHKGNTGKASVSIEENAFGRQGDPKRVSRTVIVEMSDTMRFSPASLTVKRGETVRFLVKNVGKTAHEMVLGSERDLKEHSELMKKHPGMEHDEPYMVHVAPGKSGGIIWQFSKPGEFYYGCLVPGHFEAGMVGKVIVK